MSLYKYLEYYLAYSKDRVCVNQLLNITIESHHAYYKELYFLVQNLKKLTSVHQETRE